MIKHRDTFKFCTNCQAELKTEQHYKLCPNCGKHYFFNAKPTATVILSNDKGQILLLKRADEPSKGWWDLPGGFVDEDESLEEAAQRELMEEVGLQATDLTYAGSFPDDYYYRGEIIPVVGVIFTGKVKDESKATISDEATEFKFFNKQDIPIEQVAFDNQREFLRNHINKHV